MMSAQDVLDLYSKLAEANIEIWIDGGWAVDALVGRQLRPHKDLDIAVQQNDVTKLRELLEERGYQDIPRDDTSIWNFVLEPDPKAGCACFGCVIRDVPRKFRDDSACGRSSTARPISAQTNAIRVI